MPVGEALREQYGESLAERGADGRIEGKPLDEWLHPVRDFAMAAMMALIRADLAAVGIVHDVFTSERAIVESGAVERALAALEAAGLIYVGTLEPPKGKLPDDWEARPQTLFRSTQFGDDVDRPLKKSDGSWTYFAADIAYHLDKFRRGFAEMIDVWGADHGGYVKRMQAAVTALTGGKASARRQALPARQSLRQGRAGADVEARRHLRHLARGGGGGRQGRRSASSC